MHELSVGWLNPLDDARPTLAEYSVRAATRRRVSWPIRCFARATPGSAAASLITKTSSFPNIPRSSRPSWSNRVLAVFGRLLPIVEERPSLAWLRPHVQQALAVVCLRSQGRGGRQPRVSRMAVAADTARAALLRFLELFRCPHPLRTFGRQDSPFWRRSEPDERQRELIKRWGELDKVRLAPKDLPFVVDAYDDCIADLDEQLGRLLDRLRRRGVLDRTWLIIASDHGESFGEHAGVFCHGTSLYQTELHVPLLIVPPGGDATQKVIKETVSLRDLAATIVDVLGLEAGSPFPGSSLARYWREVAGRLWRDAPAEPALSEVVPGFAINVDAYGLPEKSWPLGALDDGDWSYIRGEGNVHEELFHLSKDGNEQRNLARDPAAQPILDRMRQTLGTLTGGPFMPDRFNR